MGVLLADLAPRSVSLASRGGSARVCTGACGVTSMPATGPSTDDLLPPYRDLQRGGDYTSIWSLGPSTASPPAVHAFRR